MLSCLPDCSGAFCSCELEPKPLKNPLLASWQSLALCAWELNSDAASSRDIGWNCKVL